MALVRLKNRAPGLFSSSRRGDDQKDASSRKSWLALVFVLPLLLGVGCSSSAPVAYSVVAFQDSNAITITKNASASVFITSQTDASSKIKDIRISPASIVVDRDETIKLSARVYGADGLALPDVEFVWTAADPRAGTISNDGVFSAGANPGIFEDAISVTSVQDSFTGLQYASATASVTVIGEASSSILTEVAILPGSPTVLSGQIYRLRAVGFDEDGLIIQGISFVWRVNDSVLGRVNDTGYLTVEALEGTYRDAVSVTGIWDGVEISRAVDVTVLETPESDDFLNVQVLPQRFQLDSGGRLQLRAVALNGLGELVNGTELRWSMIDSDAGSVGSDGVFFAGDTPGVYTEAVRVEAIVPGQQGLTRAVDFASVVIRSEQTTRRLENVRVFPGAATVTPKGRVLLTTLAVDEFGDPVKNLLVSWATTQDGVGEMDDLGRFVATGSPGKYPDALRVTVIQQLGDETITRTETVDVIITGALAELEIRPKLTTIDSGQSVHFSILGLDENGVA
ncbi:MAG: hypothetical protein IIC22_08735, partial [Chloroflexi bacterium]|nr:hypothetical protein [Chloroflexota bacterium]